MGCLKSTKRVLKGIGNQLKAGLISFGIDQARRLTTLGLQDPEFFTNSTKRKLLWNDLKRASKDEFAVMRDGVIIELSDSMLNLLTEYSVTAMKSDEPDESFIPDDDDTAAEELPNE